MRLLTLEDVVDIQVDPNWSPLDLLGAVCERACEVHEKEEIKKIQENSPSRMAKLDKSPTRKEDTNLKDDFYIKNRDTAIVDGSAANSTKIIMKSAERREFKKRVMGFDMKGFTCWKSNNTTDVLTGYKKQSELTSEERLSREKKLKRPMDEVERRISPSRLKRKRSLSDDDQVVPKKRNFIKFKRTESETEHAELELPENVKNRINELGKQVKKVKLIIEKTVYKTDASESHNRLSMPAAQISGREKFLNDEEEEYLCMRNGKKVNSKKVRVIDPSLRIGELELRRWEMKKVRKNLNSKLQKQKEESKMSVSYVLNGKWTEMRIHNNIKEGNRIQLWAVRMDDDELIIVLVKLPDEEDEVTREEEADIEEEEGGDGADSKTNVATTSKQHQD